MEPIRFKALKDDGELVLGVPSLFFRNWVISNKAIAAALMAKGNHYRFIYAKGAGHCDDNARNQVMPQGLIWLWRGYKAN